MTTPRPSKTFAIPAAQMRDLPIPDGMARAGCFATDRVTVDGAKIGYMYREAPANPVDTGWRFFSGDEDKAYIDDLSHTGVYSVNTIANYDPDIIPFLVTPAPCAFEKIAGTQRYQRVAR